MSNPFFDHPILNSPYESPSRHWELDDDGQPTQKTLETRRSAKFFTPIPKSKKRKGAAKQEGFIFDDGAGLSTKEQQYDPTSIINEVRWLCWECTAMPSAMATAKTTTLTFRIDPGLKEALRSAAAQEHRSLANMVEVMIRDYCGRAGVQIAEQHARENSRTPAKSGK